MKSKIPTPNPDLNEVDKTGKEDGFKYCQFATWVLKGLLSLNNPRTALSVLMCLYETWFRNYDHHSLVHNRVRLTSGKLKKKYGISRYRKYRGLKTLETLKIVSIERANGRNPDVWLLWPLKGK